MTLNLLIINQSFGTYELEFEKLQQAKFRILNIINNGKCGGLLL
jgi:hypothetical protein